MINFKEFLISETEFDLLSKYEEGLTLFSQQTGDDLMNFYLERGEKDHHALHMGNKLKKEYNSNNAVFFISGTDADYKFLMRLKYCKNLDDWKMFKFMQFFHWISCSLSKYHLSEIFDNETSYNDWKNMNNTEFFFSLSVTDKKLLILKYNDSYDRLI